VRSIRHAVTCHTSANPVLVSGYRNAVLRETVVSCHQVHPSSMPANDAEGKPLQLNLPPIPQPHELLPLATADAASQDDPAELQGSATKAAAYRPPMIYTRPQMLHLQNSPLVKCPPDMPELKYWFGCVFPIRICLLPRMQKLAGTTNQVLIKKTLNLQHLTVRGNDGTLWSYPASCFH
jgi:hypothetical protein